MRCPEGHENREGAAFCIECGAKLALICPRCGRALPPAARFCDGCGQAQNAAAAERVPPESISDDSVRAAPAPPAQHPPKPPPHLAEKIAREGAAIEGERRNVTVLFIDAVGSTPAGERLDPEELHRIIRQATDKMIEAVNRFEGTVTQFRGDGIMAVFGAPIAHEDSARRAVTSALAMREALAEGRPAFGYRIGLNTGPVIVGSIGSDFSMDYTAIGDTVNLAARMEQAAAVNTIYISEHTQRLVAPYFELRELGELAIKGKSEPVRAYEVLCERPARTRLEASAERGLTPYVGRREQLELLRDHFELACSGQGQVVFVQGEPGMGKSRLLLEFRRWLEEGSDDRPPVDVAWREGRCISWGRNFPYLPIVDIVRETFGVEEGDDDARIASAIEERAGRWDAAAAASAVPQLEYLLSVGVTDAPPMDPQERRARVLDALRALLMQEARLAPLVVVVEDLHWADEQSEEALAALVDAVASSRFLLILTYRPGYVHALGDRTYYGRLVLRNLPPDESASMVSGVLQAAGIPARLQAMIVEKAEGNPFFIEEVSRSLVESSTLRRAGDRYTLVRPVEQVTIPDTIQEVILSRIDRLQRRAKEAVQYASVIGREFPVRLLKAIHSAEEGIDALLGELKSLELIYEKSYFPELEFMFKHALTQEVALSTLLIDRRKALHRNVAAAIEELYADRLSEQYEALAYHYSEGEEWEKACEYAKQVARRAAGLHAPRAVVGHATRAIEAALHCDEECCNALLDDDLYRLRGLAYEALGEFDQAREDHESLLRLARERGHGEVEWQANIDLGMLWAGRDYNKTGEYWQRAYDLARQLGNETLIAHSLNRLGNWRINTEHPVESVEYHEQALEIFQRLNDKRGTAESLDFLSMAHGLSGDMTNATRRALEGVELYRELDDKQGLSGLLSTLGFHGHGFESLTLAAGQRGPAELAELGAEGLRIADDISWLPGQAFALCQQSLALGSAGAYGRALAAAKQALDLADSIGHAQWQTFAHYNLASIHTDLFALERAKMHFERAIDLAKSIGSVHWMRITTADYVRLLAREREFDRAQALLSEQFEESLPMISLGQRGLWLARAELSRACGDLDSALRVLDDLCATAKNAGDLGIRAVPYAAMLRGQVLTEIGRLDAASDDIEAALEGAHRLGIKPLEWQALAAAADHASASGDAHGAGTLSAQALEVVEQLASSIDDAALRHLYLIAEPVERLRTRVNAGAF